MSTLRPNDFHYYKVKHTGTGAKREVCIYSWKNKKDWRVSLMVRDPKQNIFHRVHQQWSLTERRTFKSQEKALLFLAMEDWIVQKPWWQRLWRKK
jgi:hypothetical protein